MVYRGRAALRRRETRLVVVGRLGSVARRVDGRARSCARALGVRHGQLSACANGAVRSARKERGRHRLRGATSCQQAARGGTPGRLLLVARGDSKAGPLATAPAPGAVAARCREGGASGRTPVDDKARSGIRAQGPIRGRGRCHRGCRGVANFRGRTRRGCTGPGWGGHRRRTRGTSIVALGSSGSSTAALAVRVAT